MIGKKLSQYEITAHLGRGGMGEVYRARDTLLDRDVAIKVLPPEVAESPSRLARFEREAKAVAALNHENIVTIHNIGNAEGVHFLAMELVEGETLDRKIPAKGLDNDALLKLAVPVASALAAAHAKGIVHRDLKPGNVMVTDQGKVKVLDFGLAKLVHQADEKPEVATDQTLPMETLLKTQEGAILGTVPYMSPEQLSGKTVGPASDIFSAGILFYEMATGSRPFKGGSAPELISSILTDDPPPVGEMRPQLAPPVGDLIGQCLAKDPADRPSSAEQLRRDLQATSAPASEVRSPAPPRSKGRTIIGAVMAVAVILAAISGWQAISSKSTDADFAMLRLAVLPFEAVGDESASFVAGGLTDEIALRLAGLRALAVVPATGTVSFRDSDLTAIEFGKKLEADYIVTGKVTADGAKVRVEPHLTRVSSGEVTWSDTYGVSNQRILELQSDIANEVALGLGVALSAKEKHRLEMRLTDNPVAYEAYLKGVEAQPISHDSEPEYRRALQLFEHAVKLDPEFALAWVKLAHNELQMYWLGYDRTEARLQKAADALDRAQEIAPDLPDVRLERGYMYYHGSLNYDKALEELSLAAKDIPNDPELIGTIGYIWRRQGMFEQAISNLERMRELMPYDRYQNVELAYTRLLVDDYESIFQDIATLTEFDPDYDWGYMLAAFAYWHRGEPGDLDRARAEIAKLPDPRDEYPIWFRLIQHWNDRDYEAALSRIAVLSQPYVKLQALIAPRDLWAGQTYLMMGEPEKARSRLESALELLNELDRELPDDHRIQAALGLAHAGLGHKEEAVRFGRRAVELYPSEQDALMGPDRLWDLVQIYATVGEYDQALNELSHLLSMRTHYSAAMLDLSPALDPLRDDPRYVTLMTR